jgi:hypothetical protein
MRKLNWKQTKKGNYTACFQGAKHFVILVQENGYFDLSLVQHDGPIIDLGLWCDLALAQEVAALFI